MRKGNQGRRVVLRRGPLSAPCAAIHRLSKRDGQILKRCLVVTRADPSRRNPMLPAARSKISYFKNFHPELNLCNSPLPNKNRFCTDKCSSQSEVLRNNRDDNVVLDSYAVVVGCLDFVSLPPLSQLLEIPAGVGDGSLEGRDPLLGVPLPTECQKSMRRNRVACRNQ